MWERCAAPALMVAAGLSMYAGAALAVGLFDVLPPTLVAWLRIAAAGVLLLVLRRPRPGEFLGRPGAIAAVFGVVTLGMNMSFYQAIATLPLGTAVAIEFLGPIAVAAWGSRSIRDWCALLLAGGGVSVLSGVQWSASAAGVVFALLAAALWALYIVVGARVAKTRSKNSLAVSFCWAAVLAIPLAILLWPAGADGGVGMPTWQLLALAAGLGLLSAVIPYSLDQVILRITSPDYFAVLLALLPLTAALLGAVVLGQVLSFAEMLGITAVVAAVVLRQQRR